MVRRRRQFLVAGGFAAAFTADTVLLQRLHMSVAIGVARLRGYVYSGHRASGRQLLI
jgi:hypothetical protein